MSVWKEYLREVQGHLEELRAMGITDLVLPPAAEPAQRAASPARPQTPGQAPVGRAAPVYIPPPAPPARAAPQSRPATLPAGAPAPKSPVMTTERVATDDSLAKIEADLAGCTRCKLSESRSKIVFGAGNPNAELMFIGEAPGPDEDAAGIPFVGKEGALLTKMIEAMGLTRDDVYLANIVKCRPPSADRIPMIDEVETCYPFLRRQIAVIQPKIIVTLGASASHALLGVTIPIARLRGTFCQYGTARVMPTFHPSYLLRDEKQKKFVWEDLQKVMAELGLERKTK